MRIGFFDSGIGGLTVLHEALRQLPGEEYLYFADTDAVPYGDKPKEQVRSLVLAGVDFLVSQGIQALVVACNTATAVAIEELRRIHPFPIIGMEPAVKPALEILGPGAPRKQVLVLATDMTLREEKFHRLVDRVDEEGRVDYLSLQGLVRRAEAFAFDDPGLQDWLRQATAHLDLERYGAVVLGCTHFPLFRPQLRSLFLPGTRFIDGNRGTVNHLRNRIDHVPEKGPGSPESGSLSFFESGRPSQPERFRKYLERYESIQQQEDGHEEHSEAGA